MYKILSAAVLVVACGVSNAQNLQRRASIVGGGDGNGGKCTIEVVVDGAVEVQFNGDTATLNNLSGRPPEWRRFECTGRMPSNPAQFQFRGVDGRGRQELTRDPRNGGPAVVRIEDPQNGAEAYTFDIVWGGGQGNGQVYGAPNDPRRYGNNGRYPEGNRQAGRFSTDQAISVCRDEVKLRAAERFGTPDIQFQDMRADDNPGRGDWVIGSFLLRRDRSQAHQFTCEVNFDNGQVRSVQIDQNMQNGQDRTYNNGQDRNDNGGAGRPGVRDAVQTCRRAAEDSARERGYSDVEVGRIQVDDRPGRNDSVVGSLRASRGSNWDRYDFVCRVDLRDGDVKAVDLNRR